MSSSLPVASTKKVVSLRKRWPADVVTFWRVVTTTGFIVRHLCTSEDEAHRYASDWNADPECRNQPAHVVIECKAVVGSKRTVKARKPRRVRPTRPQIVPNSHPALRLGDEALGALVNGKCGFGTDDCIGEFCENGDGTAFLSIGFERTFELGADEHAAHEAVTDSLLNAIDRLQAAVDIMDAAAPAVLS